MQDNDKINVIWKETTLMWLLWLFALAVLVGFFYDSLFYMVKIWNGKEEYGHGFLIPPLVGFFIWQKKEQIANVKFENNWNGLLIVFLGLLLYIAGKLSTLYIIIQYAFVIIVIGLAFSYVGKKAFKIIALPLVMLFFMIPLPDFLYQNLSAQLQLVSTYIGVLVIRLMDISVFVEGNVIDLGVYKLQVVEACSGLRYLFPLMTLGFISAYIFDQALWKKSIIFLSTIPITVFMNSFRIGVIGIMVEYWGQSMAEGFLHDFEGWIVFMSCMGLLIIEMWLLVKIGQDKKSLVDAFAIEFPEPISKDAKINYRPISKSFVLSVALILLTVTISVMIPERADIEPDRKQYTEFPLQFSDWKGRSGSMEQIYIDRLKFTDYIMNDYIGSDGGSVNFYSAYYSSQKKGASAHSPRSCIPGGGWRIASLTNHLIEGVTIGNVPLVVNRLVIKKGEVKQLVYYWFQQRGRIVTNEYLMKLYLFWDSITKHRTDGALMRFTTILEAGQDIEIADRRLESFASHVAPIIADYVPE